jgi:hypothetical protein
MPSWKCASIFFMGLTGPMNRNRHDTVPCGSCTNKPSSTSWLNSEAFLFLQVMPSRNKVDPGKIWCETLKCSWNSEWSALLLKSAPNGCNPRASCYLIKKMECLLTQSFQKNLKTSPEDMCPVAPKPVFEFSWWNRIKQCRSGSSSLKKFGYRVQLSRNDKCPPTY